MQMRLPAIPHIKVEIMLDRPPDLMCPRTLRPAVVYHMRALQSEVVKLKMVLSAEAQAVGVAHLLCCHRADTDRAICRQSHMTMVVKSLTRSVGDLTRTEMMIQLGYHHRPNMISTNQ